MATVGELSDPYANFMANPLSPSADDVCEVCTTFTEGYPTCFRCASNAPWLDAMVPISYSVHFGQLHTSLAGYKRGHGKAAARLTVQLAAVMWRFLGGHEACLAEAAGVERFDIVTTVPSSSAERDERHPLRKIVGSMVEPTQRRYERLLKRSSTDAADRTVDIEKYEASRSLAGDSVLLIDDTWTTGASMQSAAGRLKECGAGAVAGLVIGRHVNEGFGGNADRLASLPRRFDWSSCALCTEV